MEEHITELIPDLCDENFNAILARNVDSNTKEKAVLSLLVRKTIQNNKIDDMYKTNRFRFAVRVLRHSVKGTKSHGTRLRLVPYFSVLFALLRHP